jgi:hypothetical protein
MVAEKHFSFVVAPLIVLLNIIFVASGAVAALLTLGLGGR